MSSLTTPAAELGDANDQRPALAWWKWGHVANWQDKQVGQTGLPITFESWSMPVWDGATTARRVRLWPNPAVWDEPSRWQSIGKWPVLLPWGTRFRAGVGTDNACIVDHGDISYEVQNLRIAGPFEAIALAVRTRGAYRPGDYVCDLVHVVTSGCLEEEKHLAGALGKARDREGLLTAEQAANGVTTALAMGTFNAQFGPPTMAFPPRFVPPATRIEHTNLNQRPQWLPAGDDQRMIPRGTRFRLSMTDREIDDWAMSRHDGTKSITAVIIATGLRDYGWFDSLTVSAGPYLQATGVLNPAERAVWADMGLKTERDFRTLLDVLFTPTNIKVVRAA